MRISQKSGIHDLRKGSKPPDTKKTGDSLFSLFSTELKSRQQHDQSYQQGIDELRNQLDQAGERLEKDPTITNFKQFREILSSLVKQVSGEAYRLEKIGGTPSNPRYYEIITVINKEADSLYQLIVREQKDRMAITASVIGIKGLIVDLMT